MTFIGKKYDVASATTTEEVQKEIQKQSGGDATKLPSVIFGAKQLEPTAFLRDSGVTDGAELTALPDLGNGGMADLMKQAGLDTDKLNEMMGSMGGGAGGGGMPSMDESMKMMSEMMNNPMIQEMMNDPERLEQSRQMILNNPMLKVCILIFSLPYYSCVFCVWLAYSLMHEVVSDELLLSYLLFTVYDGRYAWNG